MKKVFCLILSLLLGLSCFSACGAGPATTTKPSTTKPPQKEKLSVLFIGNSYTYYNNMPTSIFGAIAEAAGYESNVISITGGGWSLYQHADVCPFTCNLPCKIIARKISCHNFNSFFGKSLHDLVNEGLHTKLSRMPMDARMRVQETVERVINEGCNGLVCILL